MGADHLQDEQGFRVRGAQPTRMDAFVDAAFAFAVTLLVIGIGHVPSSIAELAQAMRGVPAFAASFVLIARFWHAHRTWSRRYAIEDGYSTRLSLLLVFVILVYVYPLRMVATMVFGMISGGRLAEQAVELRTVGDLRFLYATFAIGYAVAVAVFALLYRHALHHADAIGLSPQERVRTRTQVLRYTAFLAISLSSLLLALLLPMGTSTPLQYPLPGFVYALALFVPLVLNRRERAALAQLEGAKA